MSRTPPVDPAPIGAGAESNELARLTISVDQGVVRAALEGEIDISNVGAIASELHALPNDALGLVLDLQETTFIDSSAVALLYGMRERLRRRGQALRVVVPLASSPRRVLELTGYETGGPLDVDVASATQAIRAVAGSPAP